MKFQNIFRTVVFLTLVFSVFTTNAQFNLKKVKKELKTEVEAEGTNQKEKLKQKAIAKAGGSSEELCSKLKGDKEITSSSAAYESYSKLLTALNVAEQKVISGDNTGAQAHMDEVGEHISMVLLKEPKADFTGVCEQITQINTKLK